MVNINVGKYRISFEQGQMPSLFEKYIEKAMLYEQFNMSEFDGELLFLSVGISEQMPFLVIKMKYSPCVGGFDPSALIIEDKDILFIGAGQTVLIYDLKKILKIDEDFYNEGVLRWKKHKNYVFLLAECDIACWSDSGKKLWNRFADPPYELTAFDNKIKLIMMDETVEFNIEEGPLFKNY